MFDSVETNCVAEVRVAEFTLEYTAFAALLPAGAIRALAVPPIPNLDLKPAFPDEGINGFHQTADGFVDSLNITSTQCSRPGIPGLELPARGFRIPAYSSTRSRNRLRARSGPSNVLAG